MKAKLSSYVIRAYKKGNGRVSLHLRSHIMFETNASFSVGAYLKDIKGFLELPQRERLELDSFSITAHSSVPYNGKYLVHELHLASTTNLKELRDCMGKLYLAYEFDFHGAKITGSHENESIIRKMYI